MEFSLRTVAAALLLTATLSSAAHAGSFMDAVNAAATSMTASIEKYSAESDKRRATANAPRALTITEEIFAAHASNSASSLLTTEEPACRGVKALAGKFTVVCDVAERKAAARAQAEREANREYAIGVLRAQNNAVYACTLVQGVYRYGVCSR